MWRSEGEFDTVSEASVSSIVPDNIITTVSRQEDQRPATEDSTVELLQQSPSNIVPFERAGIPKAYAPQRAPLKRSSFERQSGNGVPRIYVQEADEDDVIHLFEPESSSHDWQLIYA
jgi:hypothetical protein